MRRADGRDESNPAQARGCNAITGGDPRQVRRKHDLERVSEDEGRADPHGRRLHRETTRCLRRSCDRGCGQPRGNKPALPGPREYARGGGRRCPRAAHRRHRARRGVRASGWYAGTAAARRARANCRARDQQISRRHGAPEARARLPGISLPAASPRCRSIRRTSAHSRGRLGGARGSALGTVARRRRAANCNRPSAGHFEL